MLAERLTLWAAGNAPQDSPAFFGGGLAAFTCTSSNFNAATVTLNWIAADGTALPVGSTTTVTANAFVTGLNLPAGKYSATFSGGTPTAVTVTLDRIPY
jgi:hypothetical protein